MTYPVIVICIAFAITTFLIVQVVPVFGEIFADFGAQPAGPTQFLLDVSALHPGRLVDPRRSAHRGDRLRRSARLSAPERGTADSGTAGSSSSRSSARSFTRSA
mgnify:CR=1 FL=1